MHNYSICIWHTHSTAMCIVYILFIHVLPYIGQDLIHWKSVWQARQPRKLLQVGPVNCDKRLGPQELCLTWNLQMGVSKNRGTPKSSILIGFSIINHPFWGTPIFGNTQMNPRKMPFQKSLFSNSQGVAAYKNHEDVLQLLNTTS